MGGAAVDTSLETRRKVKVIQAQIEEEMLWVMGLLQSYDSPAAKAAARAIDEDARPAIDKLFASANEAATAGGAALDLWIKGAEDFRAKMTSIRLSFAKPEGLEPWKIAVGLGVVGLGLWYLAQPSKKSAPLKGLGCGPAPRRQR